MSLGNGGLSVDMKSLVSLVLVLVFPAVAGLRAADAAKTNGDLQYEAPAAAANSNAVEIPVPQLSANTSTVPDVPMAPPAYPPVAPAATQAPVAARPRSPWGAMLAVLAVVAGSFVVKRLLSRPGRS